MCVNYCDSPNMKCSSHPWLPNSTHPVVCVCSSVMQITGAFMFRELSDIWPGSKPEGLRQRGAVGERSKEVWEVCRDTVGLYQRTLREDFQVLSAARRPTTREGGRRKGFRLTQTPRRVSEHRASKTGSIHVAVKSFVLHIDGAGLHLSPCAIF